MKTVLAEVSARHIHISPKDLEKLFGKNSKLTVYKDISQPGQFAAKQTVELVGPKNTYKKVRIVGPCREKTQVELAVSDAVYLGVKPVLKVSGDHKGSSSIKIKGPKGSITIKIGAIVPKRHLHISKEQAKKWGLKNKQLVNVKTTGKRAVTFHEVIVRTGPFVSRIHLDTDEANAAGVKQGDKVSLLV